ncbi:hypothetical protein llap_2247 [Limosa lapponica baueri]|uniref:Uncharacterized protein n=1 Tax=Limosa lapponica baueri TaxID=1758121 RepID=A0A2I0UN05_LIMLA|nr:hypothetical protein llap_2247 [Limosa lapponica baueri]
MVEQIATCSPWRTPHQSRRIPEGGCEKPMLEQDLGRICGPVEREARAGAGLLAGLVPWWGNHAGAVCSWKDCTPWKGPMLQQFVKNCSPWKGLTLEKFMEDCLPWEGPHTGAGEECEEPSP